MIGFGLFDCLVCLIWFDFFVCSFFGWFVWLAWIDYDPGNAFFAHKTEFIYIDGVKQTLRDGQGNISNDIRFNNSAFHPTSFIGVQKPYCVSCGDWIHPDGIQYRSWFKGFMDEIRIFNRALSEPEILELYHLNK